MLMELTDFNDPDRTIIEKFGMKIMITYMMSMLETNENNSYN